MALDVGEDVCGDATPYRGLPEAARGPQSLKRLPGILNILRVPGPGMYFGQRAAFRCEVSVYVAGTSM